MESGRFSSFTGMRVSEIKVKSNIQKEWYWLVRECNPANRSTKVTVQPKDLGQDTEYKRGLGWMRRMESKWPCKKTFSQPQRRKSIRHASHVMQCTRGKEESQSKGDER
jgi:hypothetical protein